MNKTYANIAAIALLLLPCAAACSSAEGPNEPAKGGSSSGNSAGNLGVVPSSAGTNSTSGGSSTATTGGSSSAGTTNGSAGTAPSVTGGSGGAPPAGGGAPTTGGGASDPLACKGISSNMACAPEGTNCPMLSCGLADTGARTCKCETTWKCSACDFSNSPFKDRPANITTCTGSEQDKLTCTEMNKVCEGAPGGEVCACYPDDEGALIWDCDKKPTSWTVM